MQEEFTPNHQLKTSPIKKGSGNNKYVEKNNIVYFKPPVSIHILVLFLRILLLLFWGVFFYELFIGDLAFFDKLPLPWLSYSIFVFMGLLLSISFLIGFSDYKQKRYFDKKKMRFWLGNQFDAKKGKKIENIEAIQLIVYQFYRRIPTGSTGSVNSLITSFELIAVMKNQKRYYIATYGKRKNAIDIATRLTNFLQKPLFNEIEDFESIDEKIKRLSTNFKSRLILTDDFVIDQTKEKISTILKNKEHYIISNSTHSTFQVDPTPLGLSDYNLGNYINQGHFRGIKAYLNLTTSEKQTKIEMYTKFRYEFLLYLIIIISVWIFDVHHMIKSVVTITAIFFIWLQRSNEKELFTFIKIDIESSSKNDNIES